MKQYRIETKTEHQTPTGMKYTRKVYCTITNNLTQEEMWSIIKDNERILIEDEDKMITKQQIGHELYVYFQGRLIYKRWLPTHSWSNHSRVFHENEGLTQWAR